MPNMSKQDITKVLICIKKKEIVFAEKKQNIPKNINDCVERTMFLCLMFFSIYAKMQCLLRLMHFFGFMKKFKMPDKNGGKRFLGKVTSSLCI